jgi:hypothetical protein
MTILHHRINPDAEVGKEQPGFCSGQPQSTPRTIGAQVIEASNPTDAVGVIGGRAAARRRAASPPFFSVTP